MVEYYSNDFDFSLYALECGERCLPEITALDSYSSPNAKWDKFYETHGSGDFFKPRRYIEKEFHQYLSVAGTVLEVGCGYGCTAYPLLSKFDFDYIATEYSNEALLILQRHSDFDPTRVTVEFWDVSLPRAPTLQPQTKPHAILCIFALSAVTPNKHIQCLTNMKEQLREKDSVILFRDYAVHDMTMYRHVIRHGESLYRRNDGTLAYYFDQEYLKTISNAAGLECVEVEYATVSVRNRKKAKTMNRVFLHAVLRPS
jgi:methyltransferase-like protein 6